MVTEAVFGFPVDYHFFLDTVNWNDGNFGGSLLANANGCGVTTQWTWETRAAGEGFNFGGGFRADHWGGFTLPIFVVPGCGEHAIERALDLPAGSVSCGPAKSGICAPFTIFC